MVLGLLGDIHGHFDVLERVLGLEPDIGGWLCVGDVASDEGAYPSPSRPFYFIKGNNEDFDVITRLETANLFYLPNGVVIDVCGVRVAGLGGTFAPKWYETPPDALPAGKPGPRRDDKRRHFVRQEVEACAALRGVDIFLTHEAARPYWVGTGRRRNDAGKTAINDILAAMKPRLHLFGHHHCLSEAVREGVPSIGLPLVADGYAILDTARWAWTFKVDWTKPA